MKLMTASHFTIYNLETDLSYGDIIDAFNENKPEKDHYKIRSNGSKTVFDNIRNYELYIRRAITNPDWIGPLNNLVIDLGEIENINFSYVLFAEVDNKHFAITGGSGYRVIEKYKRFNFGVELLSRLIEPNENLIKSVQERYLTGKILGSNSEFWDGVTLNSEKDFNKFFKEIYLGLPSNTIEEKLGIKITTKKKDYSFLAKDSIKLGKSITVNELDSLLGSVVSLLKEKGYPINQFYQLNKNDSRIERLNKNLIDQFKDMIENGNKTGIRITPYNVRCDKYSIELNGDVENRELLSSEDDIIDIFRRKVAMDKDSDDLLKIIENTKLKGIIEGEVLDEISLYNQIHVNVLLDNKNYWLLEGNWLFIEEEFIEVINKAFLDKVVNDYDFNFNISKLKQWPEGISETDYNYMHNQVGSVYVLDRMLVNNIEICDLFIEDKEKNELYLIHVKDGLDGDVRVLTEQIKHSMRIMNEIKNGNPNLLGEFYDSIVNKINNKNDKGNPTKLAISAKKFKDRFNYYDDFKERVLNCNNIYYVFAYRALDSHDVKNPETITSTAAKFSMIDLIESLKEFEFKLEFLKIER